MHMYRGPTRWHVQHLYNTCVLHRALAPQTIGQLSNVGETISRYVSLQTANQHAEKCKALINEKDKSAL